VSAPATPDAALAAALLNLRRARGQTQEDLAHAAGLTVTAYARIERGSANPTWTTVRRIAAALDVSVSELGQAVERHSDEAHR
jgi:transcriptional regulator with XRE-family HTH domain